MAASDLAPFTAPSPAPSTAISRTTSRATTPLVRSLAAALLFGSVGCATIADEAVYHAPPGSNGSAPYSEAVVYDDFIFLAGQLGIVPGTRALAEGGVGPETRQALENMQAALERAGGSMDSVLKCTVFLADIAEWADMNAVYTTFFTNMPARTAVGGAGVVLGGRVEIECIAAAPDDED